MFLASFDPATSSWRTSQFSLLGGLDEFSGTWPRSGMTRSGIAFQLQPLAPLTKGTASGLLPTPLATMADRGGRGDLLQVVRGNPSPSGHFRWPTPDVSVFNLSETPESWSERNAVHAERHGRKDFRPPLAMAVKMWPTPTAQDAANDGGPSQFERNSLPLNAAVKWRTPGAGEGRRGGQSPEERQAAGHSVTLTDQAGGQLNPTWVEWLMGFPLGWTDCGDSETRSSRRSRSGSAGESSNGKA